jgi:hypothetical protein
MDRKKCETEQAENKLAEILPFLLFGVYINIDINIDSSP